jgi:anti-anti-sigma regulatory factor
MLRITIHDDPGPLTFQLEGTLVGPWVREAEACWQRTLAGQQPSILRLDLTGLTMIDAAGKGFLAAAYIQGAELVASGCLMRAIVAELAKTPNSECECRNGRRPIDI